MSRASVVARGRAAAEAGMVDSCVIRRQTGTATDPDTGRITPTYTDVYIGKCRVQSRNLQAGSPNAGQQRVDMYTTELQVPIEVTGVEVNDQVEITASADPELVGRQLRVANLMHATHKTARRLPLEEITS